MYNEASESSSSRLLDVAEPGALHLQGTLAFEGYLTNLSANVFAFAVTVGPNEETMTVAGLFLNVVGDSLLIFLGGD